MKKTEKPKNVQLREDIEGLEIGYLVIFIFLGYLFLIFMV
jgi:hypothetical protein